MLFMMMGCGLLLVTGGVVVLAWRAWRSRRLDRWLLPYLVQVRRRRAPRATEEIHLLLCIADHFEPRHGPVPVERARLRVERWLRDYPRRFAGVRDSDDRPPRHTFFYPLEQYDPWEIDALAQLCRDGFGEVEVHLHHDGDNAPALRQRLLAFKELLAQEHGLLSRHRQTRAVAYGFVHGNWALANCRPDGRWCGVNDELAVLSASGCYADFTFPSAPDVTQPRTINRIYQSDPTPSHGTTTTADTLLMIQGPLLLDWRRRKWGLLPRIENGCLQSSQPPDPARLDLWLGARIQVPARPDWFFVKLHTHGAPEENQRVLLGEPMVRFHEALAQRARREQRFHYHYVTAREMYNLVRAAQAGWKGAIATARDWELVWNGGKRAETGGRRMIGRQPGEQATDAATRPVDTSVR